MDTIRFAITNPVKVTVGVLLLILFGFLSLNTIPIQLVPNVDKPVITVTTTWTGRSPEEVEKQIIEEQEDKLKGVSSLRKMTAEASEGRAEIELEFNLGVDMGRVLQEVSDKLREVPEYPDEVDEPVISVADAASENAIAWMILTSHDPDFNIEQLRDVAEDRIKPFLERVDGVSEANIYGGRDREVHIGINPARLAERGITFSQLRESLQRDNVNVSAGDLRDGYRDVRIRTVNQYEDLDQIRQTIVVDTDRGPVRIEDLGDVRLTLAKRRAFVRSRGSPAIALNAIREAGANVLRVMHGSRDGKQQGLRQRIEMVNERILPSLGPGLKLTQVYDETIYIYNAINLVKWNLLIGGTLAILGLVLFLRHIRPTAIVALAIPVAVIGTFVVMSAAGRNLNVVSLAGLAFAVGMVVDNAIVVIENIDRHLSLGKSPRQAAYDGTHEVGGAILASTLTTLAVFVPVLNMEEEAGQLFQDIALAICAAVLLSLIVAVTLIPSASAIWLRPRVVSQGFRRMAEGLFGISGIAHAVTVRVAALIHALTAPRLSTTGARIVIVLLFTATSLIGAAWLRPPSSYLPDGNRNLTFGVMLTPPAYHIEHNQSIALRVEKKLQPYWNTNSMAETASLPFVPVMTGPNEIQVIQCPPIDNYFFVSFGGTIFMGASSKEPQIVRPLVGLLTESMNTIPGAIGFAFQPSIFGRGVGGGNAIEVEVTGSDIDAVRHSAEAIYRELGQVFGFGRIQPDPQNFNNPGPGLQVHPDRLRAAALNADVSQIGIAVQALIDGAVVGDYQLEGNSIDILLTRHPDYSLAVDSIGMVPLAYRDREGSVGIVPLSALTKLVPHDAPQQIRRIEEQRAVSLAVRIPDELPLEQATRDVTDLVETLREQKQIPQDVQAVPAGTADKLSQFQTSLVGTWSGWTVESLQSVGLSRFVLALLVIYLLMAALFESFLYPAVIMFSVPLATIGGFLGLRIVHDLTMNDPLVATQQLDVLTMLGFVILVGVVVNNAILIVHQALNFMNTRTHEAEPMSHREAIRASVLTRMRPIFMTTTTSVFGMLPLVLMPGPGSELYRGLGSVVLGGLIVATLFTLVVVPLVFSLVFDARRMLYRRA